MCFFFCFIGLTDLVSVGKSESRNQPKQKKKKEILRPKNCVRFFCVRAKEKNQKSYAGECESLILSLPLYLYVRVCFCL